MVDRLRVMGLGAWVGAAGESWVRLRPLAGDGRPMLDLPELVARDTALAAGAVGDVATDRLIALYAPASRRALPLTMDGLPIVEDEDPPWTDDPGEEIVARVIDEIALVSAGARDPLAFADWSRQFHWGALAEGGPRDWTDDPGEQAPVVDWSDDPGEEE